MCLVGKGVTALRSLHFGRVPSMGQTRDKSERNTSAAESEETGSNRAECVQLSKETREGAGENGARPTSLQMQFQREEPESRDTHYHALDRFIHTSTCADIRPLCVLAVHRFQFASSVALVGSCAHLHAASSRAETAKTYVSTNGGKRVEEKYRWNRGRALKNRSLGRAFFPGPATCLPRTNHRPRSDITLRLEDSRSLVAR